ncbi:hypothetical protein OHAE_2633 [Ochrobactrum soli]|uniref:Uncharacterized protein n=1 Tax=Ochrobactrum soli TaxID=2448455 RepID=A0A2P9HRJ4_9HYPH|nr:hypothetical protein OHAE_2633 [[Ochrobactrum] soli]
MLPRADERENIRQKGTLFDRYRSLRTLPFGVLGLAAILARGRRL